MAKRSGNVTSVLRNMRFSQIGRLTPRFVAPESTNAIVGLCFQGFFWGYPCSSHLYPSVFFCNFFFFWDLRFVNLFLWFFFDFFEGGIASSHTEHSVMRWQRRVQEISPSPRLKPRHKLLRSLIQNRTQKLQAAIHPLRFLRRHRRLRHHLQPRLRPLSQVASYHLPCRQKIQVDINRFWIICYRFWSDFVWCDLVKQDNRAFVVCFSREPWSLVVFVRYRPLFSSVYLS